MTNTTFPGGVWPVMLTPFRNDNKLDFNGLEELIEWYISQGVSGLFAVCQSSEMFHLTLEERVNYASFVHQKVAGRVPVIASGHISDSFDQQRKEILAVAETGVDAVILITNRLARQEESDAVWIANLDKLLKEIPKDIKLGLYECPYPYKRILSGDMTKWCADSSRFYFLKDTSCDIENIKTKLDICKGSSFQLYNANTATLLESLKLGAVGYSGVMANIQCRLYVELYKNYANMDLSKLSDELTICALIERQLYPANAKYFLQLEGLNITTKCRVRDDTELNDTYKSEIQMLQRITKNMEKEYCH